MMKKLIILFIFILLSVPFFVFADGQPPPPGKKTGNFKKSTFKDNTAWSKNSKGTGLPGPGDATGGNPAPISGGLSILIIGSLVFLGKKVHDEMKH
jgi:hypothetical protein